MDTRFLVSVVILGLCLLLELGRGCSESKSGEEVGSLAREQGLVVERQWTDEWYWRSLKCRIRSRKEEQGWALTLLREIITIEICTKVNHEPTPYPTTSFFNPEGDKGGYQQSGV
jgi:hypothetical protein